MFWSKIFPISNFIKGREGPPFLPSPSKQISFTFPRVYLSSLANLSLGSAILFSLLHGKVSWNNENAVDYHQEYQVQYQLLTVVSPNDTMHPQFSSLKKTLPTLVQLGTLDLGNHYLVDCMMLQNSPSWFA